MIIHISKLYRTIKFEKIKHSETYLTYDAVKDSEVQRIILEYCLENNINIKV